MIHRSGAVHLVVALVVFGWAHSGLRSQASRPTGTTREYMLEATMVGYRGVGGDIDGIRNPTLTALTGDTVNITIVNADLVLHDIALEKLDIRSAQIVDKGASASITFVAKTSDTYYCTIPGHRTAGMEGRIEVSDVPRPEPEGVLPDVNGRPLDLGFETGTLENWTAEGDAFATAQASGGTGAVKNRSGAYWATSRTGGSARQGTLTSTAFRVGHPYASFLIAGGAFGSTRVELVLVEGKKVIYRISGTNHDRFRPAVVNLTEYVGKDIVVRVVDEETGAPTAVYLKESPWA
jgi:plastocyanin